MMRQSSQLIFDLSRDALEKLFTTWVQGARKFSFLPNHYSELICDIVEIVTFVNAAAPHLKSIHHQTTTQLGAHRRNRYGQCMNVVISTVRVARTRNIL